MPMLEISERDRLLYTYTAPTAAEGVTFVFYNALTGDLNSWEAAVAPALREAGHGTLLWNYRGQTQSDFAPGTTLNAELIVADGARVLEYVQPSRPVTVGLSIGGLFAARTWLTGTQARGLVLINTLRRAGPRLAWVNDALLRAAEVGGLELLRDLYAPLLFNEDWLRDNRSQFLKDQGYTPLPTGHGHYRLLADCRDADWELPYESLDLPVLVITGLQDRLFLDRDDVDTLYRRLPRAQRLDLADAAHMLPAERPKALTRALLDFVAGS